MILYIYNIYSNNILTEGRELIIEIFISNTSEKPIYEQIADQIKKQVMNGELEAGEALPSMRLLAKDLRISVITTKRAYEELERDGFITTLVGKGSFVTGASAALVKEEKLKQMEEYLGKAVGLAKESGTTYEEFIELLQLIFHQEEKEE